jgi:hypothetical protein
MILTGENRRNRGKTCPSITLSITNPTWTTLRYQEISRLLWNPKVHYRVNKIPSPVHILSQINQIRTLQTYFSSIRFNITLPSSPFPQVVSSFQALQPKSGVWVTSQYLQIDSGSTSHSKRI